MKKTKCVSMNFDEAFDLLDDLTEEEIAELNKEFDPDARDQTSVKKSLPSCRDTNGNEEPQRLVSLKKTPTPKERTRAQLPELNDEENSIEENPAHRRTVDEDRFIRRSKPDDGIKPEPGRIFKLKPTTTNASTKSVPNLTEKEQTLIKNASEEELVDISKKLKEKYGCSLEIEQNKKPAVNRRKALSSRPQLSQSSVDEDDDMEESVDVDALLKALRTKGQDITIIICNNQPYMDPEILEEIAAHLYANKKIKHLSLANCNVTDSLMESFSEALEINTMLETLNLESNFISPVGIKHLIDAIGKNTTLRELRVENQYSKIGPKCESEMTDMVKENFTLLNFGYGFETKGPRDAMSRYILRNNELLREKRRRGETQYNLAKEKHQIEQFKPPWMIRRPKAKGMPMEGRQYIVKGQSKQTKQKKKKGGMGAMVNEMFNKAAAVSRHWEDKSQNGGLDEEYKRIEGQSKAAIEEEERRKKEERTKAKEERIAANRKAQEIEEAKAEPAVGQRRRRIVR